MNPPSLNSGCEPVCLPIIEPSQAGEARRLAATLAGRLGLSATSQGKIALIVTELAGNLVRHATGGEMIVQAIRSRSRSGIEVLAIDRGPGLGDFDRCLADGYSTSRTPGNGLGAVARLADEFDYHSVPGQGSVISARCWIAGPISPAPSCPPNRVLIWESFVCRWRARLNAAMPGRSPSQCPARPRSSWPTVWATVPRRPRRPARPSPRFDWTRRAHRAHTWRRSTRRSGGTRGAAIAVVTVRRDARAVCFAGVGNISGTVYDGSGQHRGLTSHNGTVGGNIHKVQEFVVPWFAGDTLVLHSDGLTSQWTLQSQALLRSKTPGVIAATLYRDYRRDRDDVTVLVARDGRRSPR